jgi:putative transposase
VGKWLSLIVPKGFMYLTAIIDLHTRFVLNWAYNTMSADWCVWFCKKPKVAAWNFNTDQGSQYTSEVHTNVLLNNGIKNFYGR